MTEIPTDILINAQLISWLRALIAKNMQLEHIFPIIVNNTLYLCWYSNQTAPARPVEASTDPIDCKDHLAFWNACIDDSKPALKFKLENTFSIRLVGDTQNTVRIYLEKLVAAF